METSLKPILIGTILATITAILYYPAVIAVGLLSYFATTPPPLGPLASEMRLKDAAFGVLSYPSRVVAGPGRGSVWSAINPLAHAVALGVAAGVLSGLVSLVARSVGTGGRPGKSSSEWPG